MSMYMTILLIISMGILLFSLGYTLSIARAQRAVKGTQDTAIPDKVKDHAYIRNPVFLTYLICFALLALIITFAALTIRW
ncbi:hypothetical protein SM124_02435 [Bacillus sp. 31A1R]|uniref:DUF3899 domain-containing protein n=1 Tax=Robertmurraya mangrovi TaxID=3098077 RepID=A0ABU5ITY7_9BACI|nr:hypothetical protein [Bacillus sp. 31A1R]MDZ5470599.1 hypothetical protein [Bacillus sp. 31A1R]